jgi:hypothetical protein
MTNWSSFFVPLIPFFVSDAHGLSVSCLSMTEMWGIGLFYGSDGHKAAPPCVSLTAQHRKGVPGAPKG